MWERPGLLLDSYYILLPYNNQPAVLKSTIEFEDSYVYSFFQKVLIF